MNAEKNLDKLREHLADRIARSRKEIESITKALASDPIAALSGVDNLAREAGRIHAASTALRWMERGASAQEVLAYSIEETVRAARDSSTSTSVGRNLADRATLAAWGELAAWIGAL